LNGARKKGGFKVYAMMDGFGHVVEFAPITESREHDQKFFQYLSDNCKEYSFVTTILPCQPNRLQLLINNRCMIKLLFKQIKQNFPLRYFWGESSNAIKMQVYCLLIAQLLMVLI